MSFSLGYFLQKVMTKFVKTKKKHIGPTLIFFVSMDDIFSEYRILNCGVPQRSILESLLFFIYIINDLPQSLSQSGSYLYADDICIFY